MVAPFDFNKILKDRNKRLGLRSGFNDPITWIDTGNYALNKMISDDFNKGVPLGAVTVFAGESGCLPAAAQVRVRLSAYDEKAVTVGELRDLYRCGDYRIEIDTPDGFRSISRWFDKGVLALLDVGLDNGLHSRCATNHLLQRSNGEWILAGELTKDDVILTVNGPSRVATVADAGYELCYDFEVDHPNHRYWGDGLSSHNSGKSYIVSGNIVRDALAHGCQVMLLDSEDALKTSWMRKLGVDTEHPMLHHEVVSTVDHIAACINDCTKDYIEYYKDTPRHEQQKLLFIVDSLGMVETQAEIDQFEKGELKGDKGIKAKTLKMLVANCIRLFAGYEIGLVATNHTYKSQDMYSPDDVISGGCLVAGTKVWLTDGTFKPIEEMRLGDSVRTLYGNQEVSHLWEYERPTFRLELSDGQVLECSPEHRFLADTPEGLVWREVANIQEDDEIIALVMKKLKVINKTYSPIPKSVYDIEVANDHHYIIGDGVVSHNSGFVFASSIIVSMNKYKLKVDAEGKKVSDVLGIRSKIKCVKTRYAKPFEEVEVTIPYDHGMDRYSGLFDMCEQKKILIKDGNRYRYVSQDGTEHKLYRKDMTPEFYEMIMREWDETCIASREEGTI